MLVDVNTHHRHRETGEFVLFSVLNCKCFCPSIKQSAKAIRILIAQALFQATGTGVLNQTGSDRNIAFLPATCDFVSVCQHVI